MLGFILSRFAQMIVLMFVVSIISFVIIELPPGDYLTAYIAMLENEGGVVSESEILSLRSYFGLDKPMLVRYVDWIYGIVLHGNFGWSFGWDRPVSEVIGDRIGLTMLLSLITLAFVWAIAVPIGIYSATHQYSPVDFLTTFLGYIGLAIPNFLLALVLVWISFVYFGVAVTGLVGEEFINQGWSLEMVGSLLSRIWIPIVVIGTASTATLIRVLRGSVLDELSKQYVVTARAKGLGETRLLIKYPVRVAINPLISTIGWTLPALISSESITGIVLNLPTTGPMLYNALITQDMYLAASFILILSALTIFGTFLSDILLAVVDPRIRYAGATR